MRTIPSAAMAFVFCFAFPALAQPPDRAELEETFRQTMSGCRLVGRFTVSGSDRPLQEERYTISRVEKSGGDRWRFHARIEYGGKSVTVPVVVAVRWAGDTPMIQVTDLKVPLLGTYTARVLIYRNRYAGTWSGGGHEGHMFGRIERLRRVVRARGRGRVGLPAAPPASRPAGPVTRSAARSVPARATREPPARSLRASHRGRVVRTPPLDRRHDPDRGPISGS